MSLQGSLGNLGLADVLQTALAGREGNLVLRRGPMRAVLHVASDQLHLIEPDPVDPDVLLDGFVYRGLLEADVLEAQRGRHDGEPLRALDALLDDGRIAWEEVDSVLRGTAEDAILDLLTWQDGDFRFIEGERASERAGMTSRVGIDVGGLLLRAAQRLDEHNVIAEELGLEAVLFVPMDAPPPLEYEGDPTPDVHALLDGQRVLDEVGMLCGLGRFSVLRSVFACVRVGAARGPTVEEIQDQIVVRTEAGQLGVVRGLLLQWHALAPTEEEPLLELVALARQRQSTEEHADALQALGWLRLRDGRADEAQRTFTELLELRPGDESAVRAQMEAAEAAGDTTQVHLGLVELARTALEDDDAEKTASLLEELTQKPDAPMEARILRGRALIRLKKREELIAEAEGAAQALGARARRRDERQAALFFRDAIATAAPERSDLLRRFRSLVDKPRTQAKSAALIAALLAIVGTAGFLLRPPSASDMLADVRAAYASGDHALAQALIAQLAEKHPDAAETDVAFRLQSENTVRETDVRSRLEPEQREALDEALAALSRTLPDLSHADAVAAMDRLHALLSTTEFETVRERTLAGLGSDLALALGRVEKELRQRRDLLARAVTLNHRNADIAKLAEYLPRARALIGDDFAARVEASATSLSTLVGLHAGERVQSGLRGVRRELPVYVQALEEYADDLVVCKQILAERQLEEAYDRCRVLAVKYLTNARLEDAEGHYRELAALVEQVRTDPELEAIRPRMEGRRYEEFIEEKLAVIEDIRTGLANAHDAEAAGDITRAVRIYTALAERYWLIRLEDIIEMPMRVETVPEGVDVLLNGEVAGRTPCTIRYLWARQQVLSFEAAGYEPERRLIGTQKVEPKPTLTIAMAPKRIWSRPVDAGIQRRPVAIGGDVLVCERRGRLSRLSGQDGSVQWARHVRTLEGTRARPVAMDRSIALVFLDGRVVYFDPDTGSPRAEFRAARPAGDPAHVGDALLIPTLDGRILGYRGEAQVASIDLEARPTAGLVLAHDHGWVGLADGRVVRIAPGGELREVRLPGRETDVLSLRPHASGLLAVKHDGILVALTASGEIHWSARELGDLVGPPAVAGDVAAVADRRGHVLLFRLQDGHPLGEITLAEPTVGGLLATSAGDLLALLEDGTLWIHDARQGVDRVRAKLGGQGAFPPILVGEDRVAVPTAEGELSLVALPPRD